MHTPLSLNLRQWTSIGVVTHSLTHLNPVHLRAAGPPLSSYTHPHQPPALTRAIARSSPHNAGDAISPAALHFSPIPVIVTRQASHCPQHTAHSAGTHMWYVVAVGDVPDACQRHLLREGLTEAGQALGDLAAQQGGCTTRLNVILNHPLKRPDRQSMQGGKWCRYTLSTLQDHVWEGEMGSPHKT